jgi:hypothetical protein
MAAIIIILFLLPNRYLFELAITPLGYVLAFSIVILFVLSLIFMFYDIKSNKKRLAFFRIIALIIVLFFWYIHKSIY